VLTCEFGCLADAPDDVGATSEIESTALVGLC